jgi:uncharacterized Fe-S radical SAM superfamily protein PflX
MSRLLVHINGKLNVNYLTKNSKKHDSLPIQTIIACKIPILWNSKNNNNNNNNKGTWMLIDVAISGDRNLIKKEAEKTLNIKTLQ